MVSAVGGGELAAPVGASGAMAGECRLQFAAGPRDTRARVVPIGVFHHSPQAGGLAAVDRQYQSVHQRHHLPAHKRIGRRRRRTRWSSSTAKDGSCGVISACTRDARRRALSLSRAHPVAAANARWPRSRRARGCAGAAGQRRSGVQKLRVWALPRPSLLVPENTHDSPSAQSLNDRQATLALGTQRPCVHASPLAHAP